MTRAYVLDYSAGRLTGEQVKAYAGKPEADAVYVGAVRYAGSSGQQGKEATKAELDSYVSNQLGVSLVYETTAGWWRGGKQAGINAARAILADAAAWGYADRLRSYYFTADEDVNANTLPIFQNTIRGAVSVLGYGKVGAYGEADVIDGTVGAKLCRWGWQTRAWSGGRVSDNAHILQLVGYVYPGGFDADRSLVLKVDWGQYPIIGGGGTVALDAELKAYLDDMKADIIGQVDHDAGMIIRGDAAHPDNVAKVRQQLFGVPAQGTTPRIKGAFETLTDSVTAQIDALKADIGAKLDALSVSGSGLTDEALAELRITRQENA